MRILLNLDTVKLLLLLFHKKKKFDNKINFLLLLMALNKTFD